MSVSAVDFARSFVWWRSDRDKLPPATGMQPERQVVRVEEVFESARLDVERVEARPLETSAEAVEAILANRNLVARTLDCRNELLVL